MSRTLILVAMFILVSTVAAQLPENPYAYTYAYGNVCEPNKCSPDCPCPSGQYCSAGTCAGCPTGSCSINCPCPFGFFCTGGSCKQNLFINMSVIVLIASFSLIAIGWMLAVAFDSPRVQHWLKGEFYQMVGTAVIVALYLSLLYFLNDVAGPMLAKSSLVYPAESYVRTCLKNGVDIHCGSQWTDMQDFAIEYVKRMETDVQSSMEMIGAFSMIISFLATIGISINLVITSLYLTPFAALSSALNIMSIIMGALATAATQLFMQQKILEIGKASIFGFLLPLGIVLRAFPFTRGAGSALIAISIGFTIFLPLMYTVDKDISDHWYAAHGGRPTLSGVDIFNQISGKMGETEKTISFLKNELAPEGYFGKIFFLIAVEATILPFFGYIIVLNIIKRIAEVLGTELDLSTLVRII